MTQIIMIKYDLFRNNRYHQNMGTNKIIFNHNNLRHLRSI
jgi:hypothetical protein